MRPDREPDGLLSPAGAPDRGGGGRRGPGQHDGVEVSQERLMSSDQSGEPPLLQEEAEPGPRTGGKDEAPPATEGGSGGMVSEACCGGRDKLVAEESCPPPELLCLLDTLTQSRPG